MTKSMDKSNGRTQMIAALESRVSKLREEQRAAQASAKARASKANRALDARRKILLGAWLLDRLGEQGVLNLELHGDTVSDWLTRTSDRAIFGLQACAVAAPPLIDYAAARASGDIT